MYDSWSHDKTLNVYRKMTPNCSGKWKDMEAVTNPDEADFHIIIDKTTKHKFDPKKAIYISAHPIGYPGHYDPTECVARIDYSTTSGFIEWWLKYDYDYLSSMPYPKKTKGCVCIMTSSDSADYQRDRLKYMDEFNTQYLGLVHMFGRHTNPLGDGIDYWFGKEILEDYNYSLEFDAYCENYFSERLADSLLMWCKPLYKGGWGVEKFIPEESFIYIGDKTPRELLIATNEPIDLKPIEEARYKILNELQVWAKVYNTIKSL